MPCHRVPRAALLLVALHALQCWLAARADGEESKRTTVILNADGSVESADEGLVVTTRTVEPDGHEVVNVQATELAVSEQTLDGMFKRAYDEHQQGQPENIQKAIDLYREAEKAGLCTPDLYNNLAVALKYDGKFDEAKEIFSKGVELFPGNKLLESNRGVIEKPPRLNFTTVEGVEDAKNKSDAGVKLFEQGVKYQKEGRNNDALSYYDNAMTLNNQIPDLYNNLALLYQEMGWQVKACDTWKNGAMIWPDHELLKRNKHIIFGGPDGQCGKRRDLQLEGPSVEQRALPPPQYYGL